MSKILIVAEKPSQAKVYKQSLFGKEFQESGIFNGHQITVTSLVGHVLTFKQPKEVLDSKNLWSLSAIPFQIKDIPFKISEGKNQIVNDIKKHFSSNFDFIINATDQDREGSFLFYELYDFLKCKTPVKRYYPTDLTESYTKNNITSKFEDSDYDRRMGDAGYGRSYMDYQFGNNNTVLFTKKIGDFVKVGRVKLGILAIIKKREQDIKDFGESRTYYLVEGNFEKSADVFYSGILQTKEKNYNHDDFKKILDEINSLKGSAFKVSSVKKESKNNAAPLPYTLGSLGKDCYSFFGWDGEKTLKVLQTLYEAKLSTYPRTKIAHLPESYRDSVKYNFDSISSHFGLSYTYIDAGKRVFDNSKVKEHSGIVPLLEKGAGHQIGKLTADQSKLYNLLVSRFFQVFADPEVYDSFIIITSKDSFEFKTQVKEVTSPGWTKIRGDILAKLGLKKAKKDEDDEDDDKTYKNISKIVIGDNVTLKSANERQGKESPPPLFTDGTLTGACENPKSSLLDNEKNASLVKSLPEAGIGTVATLGNIISEMVTNELIEKAKDKFYVTSKGNQLWSKLPDNFKTILFTARMEEQLDKIAHGNIKIKDFIDKIYKEISDDINANKSLVEGNSGSGNEGGINGAEELKTVCPGCGKGNLVKIFSSKTNKYYVVCSLSKRSGNGTCEYISEYDNEKSEIVVSNKSGGGFGGKETGMKCPNCSKYIKENDKTIFCDCGFTLWKTVSSKTLSDKTVKELIENGKTKEKVKGLKSKAGKPFEATLILDKKTGKIQFMF